MKPHLRAEQSRAELPGSQHCLCFFISSAEGRVAQHLVFSWRPRMLQ